MIKRTALAALCLLLALPAWAEPVQLLPPPTDFRLGGEDPPPSSDRGTTWMFTQWNNPEPVKRLEHVCRDTGQALEGASETLRVRAVSPAVCNFWSSRPAIFDEQIIAQDGAQLPCTRNGRPVEFNGQVAADKSQMNERALARPVSQMSRLVLSFGFAIEASEVPARGRCDLNKTAAFVAVVFTNRTRKENLFYQFAIHREGGREEERPFWWATGTSGVGGWESKGSLRFGYTDVLRSYGIPAVPEGSGRGFSVDILPRVLAVFREGRKHGISGDLENWRISAFYYGQHIWGDVRLRTRWSDMSVVLD